MFIKVSFGIMLAMMFIMTLVTYSVASEYHGYRSIVINSNGGELGQFRARRAHMIANHIAPRLRVCRSACTMFLSVPGACVYPNSKIGFHQAYVGRPSPMGPIMMGADPDGTMEMWERYPEVVKHVVGWPMPMAPAMRIVQGSTLIAAGFPQCGR